MPSLRPGRILVLALALASGVGAAARAQLITEFPIPTPFTSPLSITAGPDGNLWFTELAGNRIGRITTAGVVTEFPTPTAFSAPEDITSGPDGNLWFTEFSANKIGRITTAGVITEFPIPSGSRGNFITLGPDGNLWFTERFVDQIGRITTAGVVTEFPTPTVVSGPQDITVGPDGNLWFAEFSANKIGRITTAGVITEFPIPTAGSGPFGITAGPDGNLWFTESSVNKIGRITTGGVVTEFPIPTAASFPGGITEGPDGNLWFTENQKNQIGRITTGGATPTALAVDSAGNGVLEPNEPLPVAVEPTWRNDSGVSISLTGTSSNFAGPAGPTYGNPDTNADYGTIGSGLEQECTDCYTVQVTAATRPVPHWDATIDENVIATLVGGGLPSKTWTLHVGESFTDVLTTSPFYPSIETIFHNSVTAGCGDGTTYCPLQNNLRQEMAVFLLKSFQGSLYDPPACTGIFSDVVCTPDVGFADWIEDLYNRGVTAGCSSDPGPPPTIQYCPVRDILRSEMAVFLMKTSEGQAYVPPGCTGIFSDVPCPSTPTFPFSDWIEDIYLRGITAGCSSDPGPPPTIQFCPDNNVTRQEMAVFLTKTFSLALYGP